jgi:G3E family GTPase
MSALWTDKELEAGVLLDSVVAVVDACHISRQLAEGRSGGGVNEAQLQIAYADLVLLNKVSAVWALATIFLRPWTSYTTHPSTHPLRHCIRRHVV